MIKNKYIKPFKANISRNNVECGTYSGTYYTTHGIKAKHFITDFSSKNYISYWYCVNSDTCELGMFYNMIIGRYLMINISLIANFILNLCEWGGAVVSIKESDCIPGKP